MKQMRWKRFGRLVMILVLVLGTLAGCGQKGTSDSAGQGGQEAGDGSPEPLTELTVLLDWYPNAVHTFLYAAEKLGYFKEAGLKVHLQVPAETNDAIKLVATGKADLAFNYQMQVAISRSEGIPVKSVAAVVRHPLNRLFALASSGITSPKDLEGKTVGYPSVPMDLEVVNTMVKGAGGDPSKVNFVDIGWDLIPAMVTKRVDATIGAYENHEKPLLEKEGIELVTFNPVDYEVPDYYELVIIASDEGIKQKGDVFKKFLEAAAKGQEYTKNNPDEALQILLDQQHADFELDADIEQKSLAILLPLMDTEGEPFGSQSEAIWKEVIDWLKEHNQLSNDVDPKDVFVNL